MLIEREPRIQVNRNCRCVIVGKNRIVSGKVIDMSRTGLCLSSTADIPLRVLIHIIMGCEEQKPYTLNELLSNPDKLTGRVVRGNRVIGYGIQLIRSGKDRPGPPESSSIPVLTVERQMVGDAAVLALDGCLDVTGAAKLDRIAKEALKETKNLVLVMNEVESVLSSGVGVLINLFRDVRGRGGRLVIANPSYEVERVLSVSRADQLVSSYPTQEEALEALQVAEAHVSPTTGREAREKNSTPTVLVLQDNPHSYRLVQLALGQEFRVIHSSDVREGLRLALRNRPRVIVMDLHPPNADSSSIVKRCRETPQIRDTPILVVTTDADKKTMEDNMGHGVQDYIIKPYQSQALLDKVRSLVKRGAVGEVSDSEKGSS